MRVHDREPIGAALRRFKKLLAQTRGRRPDAYYTSDGEQRRRKKFKKRLKARLATLEAQQAGEQPVASLQDAKTKVQKRTGKP